MAYSFSDLNTAQRCLKRYEYRTVRRLQRKARATTLTQGSMMHRFLMHGFLNLQRGDLWVKGVETLLDEMLEEGEAVLFEDESVQYENLLRESLDLVRSHFERNPFDGWEILHVEEEFQVWIDGEVVTFTPDLVARDEFGKVWIIDHKSTSGMPEPGVPFATQQSLLYFAGVRAFYPEAVGFLFNFLRKKLPTEPRLNKTKNRASGMYHVNNLKSIDTTYEVLAAFIKAEAPELWGHPEHMERLAELRDAPERWYWQSKVLTNDVALDTTIDETSMVIQSVTMARLNKAYPRNLQEDRGYLSCSKCEFVDLCAAELMGQVTRHILLDFEKREEKNPYESDSNGTT